MSDTLSSNLDVRIQERTGTWAEWAPIKGTFEPLKGEKCIVIVPANTSVEGLPVCDVVKHYSKTGNGESTFDELPWDNSFSTNVDNDTIVLDDAGNMRLAAKYLTYLDNQLYQAPAISQFDFFSATTAEIGSSVAVTAFTHKETNTGNISGTLTLKQGSTTLKSGISPASSSASISYSKTFTSSSAVTTTVTLSGVNTKGTAFSKSDSIAFYAPHYYGALDASSLTGNVDIKSLGLTKHSVTAANWTGTISISNNNDQYVYFVTPDSSITVKSGGFDVTLTKTSLQLLVNGVSLTYYCYRTNKLVADTLSYVLS